MFWIFSARRVLFITTYQCDSPAPQHYQPGKNSDCSEKHRLSGEIGGQRGSRILEKHRYRTCLANSACSEAQIPKDVCCQDQKFHGGLGPTLAFPFSVTIRVQASWSIIAAASEELAGVHGIDVDRETWRRGLHINMPGADRGL
jgi:hypothetical protein